MGRLSILGFYGFLKTKTLEIFNFKTEDQYQNAIARGGVLSLIGLLFLTGSNFIYQWILARALTPNDYGIFNLGSAVAAIIGLTIVFGLDRTAVRFIAIFITEEDRAKELGGIYGTLAIFGIAAIAITPLAWAAGPYLAEAIFKKPELSNILRWLTLGLPFYALTRILMAILQGYKLIKPTIYVEQISVSIIKIAALLIAFLLLNSSVDAAAGSSSLAIIVGSLISVVVFLNYLSRRRKPGQPTNLIRELLFYTWPLFLASLLNRTNSYTETLFLGVFSSAAEVGYYTLSYKISLLLVIFYEAIHVVLMPFFSELYSTGKIDNIRSQYRSITHWTLLITLPFAILFFVQAPAIITLFNPIYLDSIPVLRILVVAQLIYVLIGPAALTLIITGHTGKNLFDLGINLILSILLDILLIPYFGAIGAAVAGAITIVIVNLLRLYQVNKTYLIQPFSRVQLKTIIAGAIAAFISIGAGWVIKGTPALFQIFVISCIIFVSYGLTLTLLTHQHFNELVN